MLLIQITHTFTSVWMNYSLWKFSSMQISHIFMSIDILSLLSFVAHTQFVIFFLIKLSDDGMAAAKWQQGGIFIILRNRSSFDSGEATLKFKWEPSLDDA